MPQYQGVWTLEQQAQAQSNQQWVTDPNFKNTTLLLQADGTGSGSQNNTFLDGSTNNFFITRNGNTTQGSFSPFSQAPGYFSNYFDGTDDRLTTSSALLAYSTGSASTQTATIEAMVYLNAYNASKSGADENAAIVAKGSTYMNFCINHTGNLILYHYDGTVRTPSSSGTVPLNAWTHVAVTLSGGVATFYINGSSSGTGTWYGISATSDPVYIGESTNASSSSINGYLSNLRISTTARTITVPTAHYTSDASTALLTCQSNRFVDNSSNSYAITVSTGTPSVKAFSPFLPTAAYSTSVVGGSYYGDGTGDYLVNTSDNLQILSNTDFTLEFWVYRTSSFTSDQGRCVFAIGSESTNRMQFTLSGAAARMELYGGSLDFNGGTIPANAWTHVAFVRSGSTITIYINGVAATTASHSSVIGNTGGFIFGANRSVSNYIDCPVSSLRLLNGTALYTSTFTPPTAPLTAIVNTTLLLNFTNTGIFDSASKTVLETVGNAQVSTTQAKFGTTSLYCPATNGNYFVSPQNQQNLLFGTGQFTVEAWIYPLAFTNVASGAFGYGLDGGYVDWNLEINTSGGVLYIDNNAVRLTSSSNLSANVWTHLCVVRTSTTVTMYFNGVSVGTYSTINNISGSSTSARLYVGTGAQVPGSRQFIGYIDDPRISKYARYTTTFTPPTAAFPLQ